MLEQFSCRVKAGGSAPAPAPHQAGRESFASANTGRCKEGWGSNWILRINPFPWTGRRRGNRQFRNQRVEPEQQTGQTRLGREAQSLGSTRLPAATERSLSGDSCPCFDEETNLGGGVGHELLNCPQRRSSRISLLCNLRQTA